MLRIAILVVALALNASRNAAAQTVQMGPPPGTPGAEAPPVAIGPGWHYEKRPNDVYMFICVQDSCNRSSRVSYRLYAVDTSVTREKFRRGQETVVKALEQQAPQGTRIAIVAIEGEDTGKVPRMYKSRRVIIGPSGAKEFGVSGVLIGSRFSATVISSSADESASDKNYALFGAAVLLFINPVASKP